MDVSQKSALIEAARQARETAYATYSNYRVGAAVLTEEGAIYPGCNVENAAYPLGSCAEAGAVSAMALAGGRTIKAVAVVGGKTDKQAESEPWGLASPCGGCRQRLAEFAANAAVPVIIATPHDVMLETTIGDLLPHAFNLKDD
ncbi:MAG: cytidine deaminase [Rhizobiales bacterium]|nr:cytidine deaminase [Hyphomicrobiales bacterium]MBO6699174.1 cytidine deaminase [Hyphomicrobiales bacterium]MBO6736712.1 cytidine deaminase [Hyphomicrobiales bacterium]MBO6912214.1 cytidine deaminase [Hyphomicrobiales bacterium]MBO6956217.1 cytidine deaminase [Hyphomicrobiales bacterium]